MGTNVQNPSTSEQTLRLQLKIWHPNCWTLEVTEQTDADLIADGVYLVDGRVKAHVIVCGDSGSDVEALVEAVQESPHTNTAAVMETQYSPRRRGKRPGNATVELLVGYDPRDSIHDVLVSNGFIPDEPIRIRDGYEYWTTVVEADREEVSARLDPIRSSMDAEIEIQWIRSGNTTSVGDLQFDRLSERQREVIELARERGYYKWPRDVSATELAAELEVSQATVLEHLRKAEAKLLG